MASAKKWALIVMGLLCGLVCVAGSWYYGFTLEAKGEAETWGGLQDRHMLPYLREALPRDARNIKYYCRFRSGHGEAIFEISERRFLEWAAKEGLDVAPIPLDEYHSFGVEPLLPGQIIHIQNGYEYKGETDGLREWVRYDKESGTGYYTVFRH
jgi:hypothetical protein